MNLDETLLYNAIRCPDGTVIESWSQHDFVEHVQEDGRRYFVDGGLSYKRIGFTDEEYEDLSVTYGDGHEKVRKVFRWGTFGKNGDEKLKRVRLCDLSSKHIENIIANCKYISPQVLHSMVNELEYRQINA